MSDATGFDPAKLAAANASVRLVEDGMKLGLGTGSTAAVMVEMLARRVEAEGLKLRCAATSRATAEQALSRGLRVESLDDIGWLDMTIDGADEVDPDLHLIKGGGAAHLREKIVAAASDRMVVIADPGKVVERLGKFPLPVEVLGFGFESSRTLIRRALDKLDLGGHDVLTRMKGSDPLITDEGNLILDLHLGAIPDPVSLAHALAGIPGVVEHGLFLGMCDLAIIGKADGDVVELARDADIDADMLAHEGE
ncbi:ribose-5-phosphate isomerase RpiA [Paracoccus sp. 1_MG-2023]|uniref:ribose-5-phosphate isomerase RpiA n=1 Tax=unclassified Paracoccus (in: a-proteobacteria) TaxID=2688777 RepID=UPI001C0869D8|nr:MULTISPECIES: ribose-5-phosphate isomerase RpiA [unclassified Paracoccus (in: a-proteobacteria)]MBU2958271.1 ribose-5-phosphate isomerase RpiA [Paracoccus sp. C2R09]MDO6668398.1 ribose-5-phosphate isomerase RpiA [Paracoccus sp. 1_MG-2023]